MVLPAVEEAFLQKFTCTNCHHQVYFHNVRCERCGSALGFDPATLTMTGLFAASADGTFKSLGSRKPQHFRYCANYQTGVCNWLVPAHQPSELCGGCRLNRVIPNLADPSNVAAWADLERAKKHLVYALLRLGMPLQSKGPRPDLMFDFVANATTGHVNGVITIDIAEADAVERERQRASLAEPYRSLLGHLRHESGHYYWMLLIEDGPLHGRFRELFGDERIDYPAALARHHTEGAPPDWMQRHVSAYASAHPWEDWAETWAHFLHIVDVIDTAMALGVRHQTWRSIGWLASFDAYRSPSMNDLMERWLPLALALNGLNRSMGHQDFYPFVLSPTAIEKLAFVHRVVRTGRSVAPLPARVTAGTTQQ